MKSLIFEESIGIEPARGTVEHDLWLACSMEDDRLWDRLLTVPMDDIEAAVRTLRALGWNFSLVEVH